MYLKKTKQYQCVSGAINCTLLKTEIYLFLFLVLSLFSTFTLAVEDKSVPHLTLPDYKPLVSSLKNLGLKGHVNQYELSKAKLAYDNGEYVLAKHMLTPLAMSGDPDAQYLLGIMCDQDKTSGMLRRNKTQSFIWYHAAARQGHSDAQHNLALAYARGEGVEVNIDKAIQWWERAAHNGNTDSQYNLGLMYALGNNGVEQNLLRARAWWYQAATQGDAAAQYNLGALYASEGTPFYNDCLAMQWLQESAQNGFERAVTAIKSLGNRGQLNKSCYGNK